MYNFDEIIDRKGTNALNTDGFRGYIFHSGPEKVFPYKDDEFVRMWVADMEFGVAPEILDELRKRIDRRIFGTRACIPTIITTRSASGARNTMTGASRKKSFALPRASFRHCIS